jgi:hypothetical protein
MKIIKKLIKRLKSHTPANWQRFGNILLLIGTGTSIPVDLIFNKEIAFAFFVAGVIGRLLVEFKTDKNASTN